ncbi:hypothetical protein [Faecalibacterium langellae]|uniref:Uncharacterized protein n=1 Tax=Faecalibacterium langellae TaxID=3435293 RepID=A0ACC9CXQ4_9FIRM|nr:hypothetical protein [Faecalibacterium prausnitzii]PDX60589.1 hypothetical protein CGS49_11445 [Faecalibacterium prausnitzii]
MGVFSRLNNAQKKLTDAENAMPGAYDNSYDQDIQDALQSMTGQNQAGTGYASTGDSYRGALSRLFNNAGAGADAAAQTAQGLSGGYGADWAQSAANQAAASQTGSTAGTLAQARADALTQWQQQLSGTSSQLNALLGQDQLERREYDGSVSNAADWRNYQYDQTQQARQEKSDFLSNAWNVLKNVGAAALEGYDAYRGYRQQDWENAFAERQYNDSLTRNELSDQMAALQQAAAYKQAGFDDAATQLLAKYGLDSTMLDTWQGLSQVDQDKLTYLTTAAGLAGSGYDTAAKSYLTAVGLDPNSIDYYSTIANRQNQSNLNLLSGQLQLKRKYGTKTGSSRSSGSRSSGKSGSTFTTSQLQTMAKDFKSMKEGDPLYDFYKQTLTDAGWLQSESMGSTVGASTRASTRSSPLRSGLATAESMKNQGYTLEQIAGRLSSDGITDNTLASIMKIIQAEK